MRAINYAPASNKTTSAHMTPDTPSQSENARSVPAPSRYYRIKMGLIGRTMKLFGFSCRRMAELCAARLDRPLTASEKLSFRVHGLMCGQCRPVPKQMENLQKLTRSAYQCGDEDSDCDAGSEGLSAEFKQRMREMLEKES